MPDACPTGPAPADIPIGGVIAVENAIIPAAHSADICCSMFATFYEPRTSVKAELDALTTSTRFGPGGRHFDDLVHHPVLNEPVWENRFLKSLRERAVIPIADQGDGNHFAFIGEIEITDEIARGVVSIPQGWGQQTGRMSAAKRTQTVSINDLTDDSRIDPVSGNAAFNGVPVAVKLAS